MYIYIYKSQMVNLATETISTLQGSVTTKNSKNMWVELKGQLSPESDFVYDRMNSLISGSKTINPYDFLGALMAVEHLREQIKGTTSYNDGTNNVPLSKIDGNYNSITVPESTGLVIGSTVVTSTAAELNLLDGITAGTISTSLAVVADSNGVISYGTDRSANFSDHTLITKKYVDDKISSTHEGLDVKKSARVATTANISDFTNVTIVDSVTLADGERVLVKEQTTASENGIYVFTLSTTTLARANDLATDDDAAGAFIFIQEGTTNGDIGFVCTSDSGSAVVGTDNLSFTQFTSAGQISITQQTEESANGLAVSKTGSNYTISLQQDISSDASPTFAGATISSGGDITLSDAITTNSATGATTNTVTATSHSSLLTDIYLKLNHIDAFLDSLNTQFAFDSEYSKFN